MIANPRKSKSRSRKVSNLPPQQRLAPFIQEYLFNHGWNELRPVQVEACKVIFDTDAHLLVSAGTASGKTEAAFLPVLTELYNHQPQSIGALYIGPIKALINDQFERLNDLLEQADIPVHMWHGDVTQSKKKKVIREPRGILQITPESLESLLINKSNDLMRLFGELQYIVIDEVHAFIGSDRGEQILCQMNRLAQLTNNEARRIGLSATLGDYSLAEKWMCAGTKRKVVTPKIAGAGRNIHLSLEHFYDPGLVVRAKGDDRDEAFNPYHMHLFKETRNQKCLVFANGRTATEGTIAAMREIAKAKGFPDVYHVHHGSIAAELRELAEAAMRTPDQPAVTAATVTFEMGIDLGQLDRVLQLEAPSSVASFLQRLGRSGRRTNASEMWFVCAEDTPSGEETIPEMVPWQLLQSIAVIQLYLEEKWIEPPPQVKYPYTLLFHQTMSILASQGELTPAQLAQQVLTLPAFAAVTQYDYRLLLRNWLDKDLIEQTPEGTIIIGLAGEKLVNNFKFYAIFPDNEEYHVKYNDQLIGTIMVPPCEGDRVSLAGRTWQVTEVDPNRRIAKVMTTKRSANASSWRGACGDIHDKVVQRMKRVLEEDAMYPYLQKNARKRLQLARQVARDQGILQNPVVLLEDGYACVFPWVGSAAFRTLERYVRFHCKPVLKTKGIRSRSPYFMVVNLGKCPLPNLYVELKAIGDGHVKPEQLMDADEVPKIQKYDEYILPEMLRNAYMHDSLNLEGLVKVVQKWP
ncbi:DEAD/DEAH box helicase [filamentous cyanobacterium LEGE 11480]|uniref:DEAD/DEAH box helicase n=1 Tax=Romeriopsis navalis LEGE 11480 TaxID=2777977 RepID=A0A928VSU9_9CYAN|nr:DEAD/DEAH box helicase [Romeriopsis navalis]MBE9032381.1 DEAD/DEAH box helicase [Romeriopsis navalis LEGE 11480]